MLDDLRHAFSRAWARKFFDLGKTALIHTGATAPLLPDLNALSTDELYDLRRDAEGVPYTRAATKNVPGATATAASFAQMKLLNAGAVQRGSWLEHAGKSFRVVNGAGEGLDDVRYRYQEPSTSAQPDIVICAGSEDFGVPPRLIATGSGASIVRSAPGGSARWITWDHAAREFGL